MVIRVTISIPAKKYLNGRIRRPIITLRISSPITMINDFTKPRKRISNARRIIVVFF